MNKILFYANDRWWVTKDFSNDVPIWKSYKRLGWAAKYLEISKKELLDRILERV